MQPKTQIPVPDQEAAALRRRISSIDFTSGPLSNYALALVCDGPDVVKFLADPRVAGDVYTLPRPLNLANVENWIDDHLGQFERGEGFLTLARDETGRIVSMTDFQFWPQWAACEFGGTIAADLQSQSLGSQGIVKLCNWLFDDMGVRLLCMTTSLGNIRSQKMLHRLGFKRMGEMDSVRPDGSVRRSLYWELAKR